MTATAQGVGGFLNALATSPFKGGFKTVAQAAIGTIAAFQVVKSATPGGKDYILETTESAFDKIAIFMALGVLASTAGYGRAKGNFAQDMPLIADAITAVPRSAVASLFSEYTSSEGELDLNALGNDEQIIQAFASAPGEFPAAARRRMQRAMDVPTVSLRDTIEDLMNTDRRFKRKVNTLLERQRNVQGAPQPQRMTSPLQFIKGNQ
jgi:hypothetical protein